MTTYKQGQAVLIPFPFTDLSTTKKRPGIIISSDKFNETQNDVIVLAITSHIPSKSSGFDFLLSEADQKSCGLPKASMVKLGKVISIDQRLIRKVLGEIPQETLTKIKISMQTVIG